jgi:hypothetical protein
MIFLALHSIIHFLVRLSATNAQLATSALMQTVTGASQLISFQKDAKQVTTRHPAKDNAHSALMAQFATQELP